MSHLDHYQDVARVTAEATAALEALVRTDDERAIAGEISVLTKRNDEAFRTVTLAAIRNDDRSGVRVLHANMEAQVVHVLRLNKALTAGFEAQSAAAHARASMLRSRARALTIACFALASLIAAGLGTGITRSIVSRVSTLRAGAKRVGAGDLSARIHLAGQDEFSDLASGFNQMAENLHRHQEELVRSKTLASIGQVAAGVAHEINNPLGVILGYVRLMQRRDPTADPEGLRVIEEEAVQCQRIVQGLLELARPETLALASVDLADLARDSVMRLEASGRLEGITVSGPDPEAHAYAMGDEASLRRVIVNVLVNAIEAVGAPGSIGLAIESGPERVALAITDKGPGIPSDVRRRIFDPFFTTKAKGTGLGLTIASATVDAHNGSLRIESPIGGGTKVVLDLPAFAAREILT